MADSELSKEELLKRVNWFEKKYGPYIEKRGLHNWKNLFRKPTLYEWVILFMTLMALFIFWAYQQDMAECREIIIECNAILNPVGSSINASEFFKEDKIIEEGG